MDSRTLPSKVDLPGIQILRGIAALAVVIHHALEESNAVSGRFSPDWLTTTGAAGVDIFFVISGFIMLHVSFRDRRPPLRPGQFLLRRVTRIYPLYWLTCLGVLLLFSVGLLQRQHWNLSDVISSFILVPSEKRLVGVSWTLVYEMYFYLIFAVTLLLESRKASAVLSTFCIIALGLGGAALGDTPTGAFLTEPIALEKVGHGALVVLKEENGLKTYGRAVSVAERLNDDRVLIAKWIRRMTNWNGRQAPFAMWQEKIVPLVEQNFAKQKTPVIRFEVQEQKILAHVSLGDLTMRVNSWRAASGSNQ